AAGVYPEPGRRIASRGGGGGLGPSTASQPQVRFAHSAAFAMRPQAKPRALPPPPPEHFLCDRKSGNAPAPGAAGQGHASERYHSDTAPVWTNSDIGNTKMIDRTGEDRIRMTVAKARALGEAAMRGAGYDGEDARILTDHVLDAALCGYEYSGLPKLLNVIDAPQFRQPRRPVTVLQETGSTAVLDGGNN